MIHYSKVVQGLMSYAETEIVGKMTGSGKAWLIGAALGLLAERSDQYIRGWLGSDIAKGLKLADGEMVDIDAVYAHVLKQAQKGSATVNVPMLGAITFSAADVECAYRHIKGA